MLSAVSKIAPAKPSVDVPNPELSLIPPSYFRSYDAVHSAALKLQTEHADLVKVSDIGDTVQTLAGTAIRPIFSIQITAPGSAAKRPTVLHVAGIHAREIAPPELLMQFADELTNNYGKEAWATNLLNSRNVVLVPIANPDGHAMVESGYETKTQPWTLTRKNAGWYFGVDNNRNFDFEWKRDPKSKDDIPSSETTPGPAAASEPETQAIQKLLTTLKPDFYIDWHSPANYVLYPWGYTKNPVRGIGPLIDVAKGAAHILGRGSEAIPMSQEGTANGTSTDYAFGKLGIPNLSVEVGGAFKATDQQFAAIVETGIPAMRYLSEAAGTIPSRNSATR